MNKFNLNHSISLSYLYFSSVSVEKAKRDEFWVLFDKAFNALYSSDEVEHREKVVGGITSMFTAATQCKDLTHNVCGGIYYNR